MDEIKPNTMRKTAKEWVEAYMQTDEYKAERAEMDREFLDFMIYGKPTSWFNDEVLNEIKTEYLDIDTIIGRYGLSEKEIEHLKKLKENK